MFGGSTYLNKLFKEEINNLSINENQNKEIIFQLLEQRKMLIEKLADNNKTYLQEEIRELDKLLSPYFLNGSVPRAIYKK